LQNRETAALQKNPNLLLVFNGHLVSISMHTELKSENSIPGSGFPAHLKSNFIPKLPLSAQPGRSPASGGADTSCET
jgi:hypothetical protein